MWSTRILRETRVISMRDPGIQSNVSHFRNKREGLVFLFSSLSKTKVFYLFSFFLSLSLSYVSFRNT